MLKGRKKMRKALDLEKLKKGELVNSEDFIKVWRDWRQLGEKQVAFKRLAKEVAQRKQPAFLGRMSIDDLRRWASALEYHRKRNGYKRDVRLTRRIIPDTLDTSSWESRYDNSEYYVFLVPDGMEHPNEYFPQLS